MYLTRVAENMKQYLTVSKGEVNNSTLIVGNSNTSLSPIYIRSSKIKHKTSKMVCTKVTFAEKNHLNGGKYCIYGLEDEIFKIFIPPT